MKIGIIQHRCVQEVGKNLDRIEEGIREAARQGARLVVLQELHNSLYFCQTENTELFDLAETIPGPSTERFGRLAKELDVVIVTSLFERRATGLYHNTAVVIEHDGTIAGKYRKMHIPDDPAYYEKFYFTPGDLGFHPIQTSVGANGLPVIAVNRTGHEADPSGQTNGIQFWGSSFVAGPQGEILYQAPKDEETVAVIDVDLQRSENVRRWWPFLRDRRIEEFDGLCKRFID